MKDQQALMSQPLPRALIVDDEPDIRELLAITLSRMDVTAVLAENLSQAYQALESEPPDLCLTDMRLPDGSGIDLVRHITTQYPQVPVAVITAHGEMRSAVEALKAGAFDFVSKPVDLPVLRNLITTALRLGQVSAQRQWRLVGDSVVMDEVRRTIAKLSRSQAPVFISGESGTGKELAARMIHEQGPRAEQPFVPVNCGAIPEELMESELFGHRKGSFTGAVADKQGLFQAAEGGTLFLDEVADLPLSMQVKMLRAIQERSVRPVGAEREVAVDVRLLSASHKNLGDLVQKNLFREDLYYRLNVITLTIPALRERPDDIAELTQNITQRLASRVQREQPEIAGSALQILKEYDFPGNVRELENILERAMTLSDGDCIEGADLGLKPSQHITSISPSDESSLGLDEVLVIVEKDTIIRALEQTRWNKTRAAKLLGLSFGALRYRMQKLGLE
jgi:two-component system response regulator PilR (NtrC family)